MAKVSTPATDTTRSIFLAFLPSFLSSAPEFDTFNQATRNDKPHGIGAYAVGLWTRYLTSFASFISTIAVNVFGTTQCPGFSPGLKISSTHVGKRNPKKHATQQINETAESRIGALKVRSLLGVRHPFYVSRVNHDTQKATTLPWFCRKKAAKQTTQNSAHGLM